MEAGDGGLGAERQGKAETEFRGRRCRLAERRSSSSLLPV